MGRILKALRKHAKESQRDNPQRNFILTDLQLLFQYDPNTPKSEVLDNLANNADPKVRPVIGNNLICPDGKLTQAGPSGVESFVSNKDMISGKRHVRNHEPSAFDNYGPYPNKVPIKNQHNQYRNPLRKPDVNLTREFLPQEMRNTLPKIIDLRLIRTIFNTKFFLRPQRYIKLKSAEKIEYREKRYYIIYLETEIIVSTLLDRSGNFIIFTYKNSLLPSSPSNEIRQPHIVKHNKMLEIQSVFFNRLVGSLDQGPLAKLFYNVFQLQLKYIVNCRKGDFIIFLDQVFYQIFFNAVISFSLIIDDDGNYIEMCSDQNKMISESYLIELLNLQDPICKIDLKRCGQL